MRVETTKTAHPGYCSECGRRMDADEGHVHLELEMLSGKSTHRLCGGCAAKLTHLLGDALGLLVKRRGR